MRDDHFDALARAIVPSASQAGRSKSRRRLLSRLGLFAGALLPGLDAGAKKQIQKLKRKKKKHKKKECPYPGQRRCGNRCIGKEACCNDLECRRHGECAGCVNGQCQPVGSICLDVYGPCYLCDRETMTCVPTQDGAKCGECRICQGGTCVGCQALGECAGCSNGSCLPDGRICVTAYDSCSYCDGVTPPYTCKPIGTPCQAGSQTLCCRGNETCCPEGCFDLQADHDNCGSCDNNCGAARLCETGDCVCPNSNSWCESAGRCITALQTCCGQNVCGSGQVCCGSGDTQHCVNGSTCS
jgi:hypothetical protein